MRARTDGESERRIGIVLRELGEKVRAGDVVAEIVEPMSGSSAARIQLLARTDGIVFTRTTPGLVRAGERVM